MTQEQAPTSPVTDASDTQDNATAQKTPAQKTSRKSAAKTPKAAPKTTAASPDKAPVKPARSSTAARSVKKTEKKAAAKTADEVETPKAKAPAKRSAAMSVDKADAEKSAKTAAKTSSAKMAEQPAAPETALEAPPAKAAPKSRRAAPKKSTAAKDSGAPGKSITAQAEAAAPAAEEPATAKTAPEKKPSRSGQRGRSRGGKSTAALEVPDHVDTRSPGTPNGVVTWQAPGSLITAGDDAPAASAATSAENNIPEDETAPAKKRKRSRRGGRRRKKAADQVIEQATGQLAEQAAGAAGETSAAADAQPDALPEENPAQTGNLAEDQSGESFPAQSAEEDAGPGKRKMFVSVLAGEQVEVVLAEEGMVQEYYVEMLHQAKVKGNIYKGVVSNVDPNLQAAFVNYGGVKNGFLQIDEVHPEYYLTPHDGARGRKFPLIQKALRPGQEILVQVVKEPAGTKGAFLTSYLSLPGRFLVLTPGREQIGVSRKVEKDDERARLREMLQGLSPGKGLGVIVRTVSMGASKTNLQRDLQFLKRLWKEVRAKGQEAPIPSLIYQELALSTRAVRDYLTDDVQELWVDDEATARLVEEMVSLLFPRKQNLVRAHTEAASLFKRFNLQKQLEQIHSREVALPSGGRLVFDNTEALTAIDINSGRSGGKSNFEDMAYRTNLEAARMIPLQLRLRDIGGQVVADFIEMRDRDHWREVEKALRAGMKGDRARYDVGKVGPFGMLEMVRQRLGSSAISVSTEPCPCCKGTGVRRNMEWQAMQALREIQRLARQAAAQKQPEVRFPAERELALHLLNAKRQVLLDLETRTGVHITISASANTFSD